MVSIIHPYPQHFPHFSPPLEESIYSHLIQTFDCIRSLSRRTDSSAKENPHCAKSRDSCHFSAQCHGAWMTLNRLQMSGSRVQDEALGRERRRARRGLEGVGAGQRRPSKTSRGDLTHHQVTSISFFRHRAISLIDICHFSSFFIGSAHRKGTC